MKRLAISVFGIAALATAYPTQAQEAPFFDQVPAVIYETYSAVNNPAFDDYFSMLVDKYTASGGTPWAIYRENSAKAYRITILADGLDSFVPIQRARTASFQEFNDRQRESWMKGWGTRQVSIYNAAPAMSVVPQGFTVDDIRGLPYNRVSVYYLKWDQAPAFREALRRRSELDRDANIQDFVLTAWNGGIGTQAQVVMVRVSAESRAADAGPNSEARRTARQSYRAEWQELSRAMGNAAWRIERHDQTRVDRLSYPSSN